MPGWGIFKAVRRGNSLARFECLSSALHNLNQQQMLLADSFSFTSSESLQLGRETVGLAPSP